MLLAIDGYGVRVTVMALASMCVPVYECVRKKMLKSSGYSVRE
jgi:hypothetical protein